MTRFTPLVAVMLIFVGALRADDPPASPVPELKAETFRKWFDYTCPNAEESRWMAVPWRAVLWDAAAEARDAGKPVLLWAMNGHPLALT